MLKSLYGDGKIIKKMLDIIYKSNIDKEIIKRWETQIDECFREKIKSNL